MIITDIEKLDVRSDEINPLKEGRKCQEIILKLKNEIRENNLDALTAPQIGENVRIMCIKFDKNDIRSFINPIISKVGDMRLSRETCSSIPKEVYIRPRNSTITLMYLSPLGKPMSCQLVGGAAIKAQHAIDHLDGMLLPYVGLPVTEEFDNASEEDKEEILRGYLDSLDIKYNDTKKLIEEDKELKQLQQGIDFMTRVASGEVQLEKEPKKEKKHKEKEMN